MRVLSLLDCIVRAHASQIAFLLLAHAYLSSLFPTILTLWKSSSNTPPLLLYVSSRCLMDMIGEHTPDAMEGVSAFSR